MRVLADFRRAVDALERIATGLNGAVRAMNDTEPSSDRLDELERSRALWEADVEGMLQKAEGKLKAANNSEARERTMRKAYEDDIDPFPPDGEEIQETFPQSDVPPGFEEEMQPLRLGMEAVSPRQLALRHKYS